MEGWFVLQYRKCAFYADCCLKIGQILRGVYTWKGIGMLKTECVRIMFIVINNAGKIVCFRYDGFS